MKFSLISAFLVCFLCLGCAVPREQRVAATEASPAPTTPPIETIEAGDIRIDIIWRNEADPHGLRFVAVHVPQGYSSDHRYKTMWDTEFLFVTAYQLQKLREWGERR